MTSKAGFSLTEALTIFALIAVLATMAVPHYVDYTSDAKFVVTREKMNEIKRVILGDPRMISGGKNIELGYEVHCQSPPGSLKDLVIQPSSGICSKIYDPFTKRGWRGPYLNTSDERWSLDAWGESIQVFGIALPARTIRSCGPDRSCGNKDDVILVY